VRACVRVRLSILGNGLSDFRVILLLLSVLRVFVAMMEVARARERLDYDVWIEGNVSITEERKSRKIGAIESVVVVFGFDAWEKKPLVWALAQHPSSLALPLYKHRRPACLFNRYQIISVLWLRCFRNVYYVAL
jgi:hypothetical protein